MKVDYIIVGLGLAGLAFTKELKDMGKSFIVFEDKSQNSSKVAGGMYNPVILKRFTPVWDAIDQLKIALPFYNKLENELQGKYHYKIDIIRVFKSIEEQNNWFVASDKQNLSPFMIPQINFEKFKGLKSDFGYGKVINTGRVDSKKLLKDYNSHLVEKGLLKNESFNYGNLKISKENIEYNNITASKIVFCEGFGLKQNPYFNYLPMQEAKGELIIINAPDLKVDSLIKAAVFVMPIGKDLYKVGATFNWKDKSISPSKEGRKELVDKLNSFINVPYSIVDHIAGIRPTVKDRRPLVGTHPKYKNLAILNGLGTRGVMIAPKAAKMLYNHLENNIELNKEYAINRFI